MNYFPQTTQFQRSAVTLSKPNIVGYMSVDEFRQYHCNLTQLKFLTAIPKERLALDLNHNLNKAVKRTTDDNDEKITLLLKFILDYNSRLKYPDMDSDFKFVTYRRTLISIMCSAFGCPEPLCIMASLYNGCIYLCSLETPQQVQRTKNRSEQEKKFCAWGYKFEQYLLSDLPGLGPDIEKPVIENEEFSIFYQSTLGQHKLLYGAQIDGLLASESKVSDPPKTTDVDANISYLKSHSFIELKTNREIQSYRQELNFKKYKLLHCWCQCYLAGLKGLVVGFRNDEGIVQRLQWFDTQQITSYCKNVWNPQKALQFLDMFLTHVKECFKEHIKETIGPESNINMSRGPISLQFELDVNRKISVKNNNLEIDAILPTWFVDGLRNKNA